MSSRSFRSVDKIPAVFERVSGGNFSAGMLARTQGGERLRNVPFPRRGDVDEVKIIASDESFKISLTVRVNRRCLLTGLLDELRRTRAFVFYDVADCIHDDLIDREKLLQGLGAAQTDADDSEAHHVVRLEAHADHGSLLRATNLRCFFFRRVSGRDVGGGQSDAGEAGGFEQIASR